MKIICAWCGSDLGEKEPYEDTDVSHGCCSECLEKLEREFRELPPELYLGKEEK
jgi:hypothetical protein